MDMAKLKWIRRVRAEIIGIEQNANTISDRKYCRL
jgi:hypothetical protein